MIVGCHRGCGVAMRCDTDTLLSRKGLSSGTRNCRSKNWDPAFDGFRIAMIGDIHGGSNWWRMLPSFAR